MLSIVMATFDDFDRLRDTIQALRMYHDMNDVEIVVVDNAGQIEVEWFCGDATARYLLFTDKIGTAAPRQRAIEEAKGEYVCCMDSHVFLFPGVVVRLKEYFAAHPDTKDLLQGPLIYNNLCNRSDSMSPVWGEDGMFGKWKYDAEEVDHEIALHGLGLFAFRKAAWPGFNPAFRSFGGEEGYIHEKFRRAGGKCLCLPWLRWWHSFNSHVTYPCSMEDKFTNYLIGHEELGMDASEVVKFYRNNRLLSEAAIQRSLNWRNRP